jgi:hypothetical protein
MPYGSLKIDRIIFTRGGTDYSITVSGLAEATTGSTTYTGNVSGQIANFIDVNSTSTISGNLITGNTVQFTNITGVSGTFTSRLSGNTVTGDTLLISNATGVSGTFTTHISGATVTGNTAQFTTLTGGTGVFTSTLSGLLITGNTGQFTNITGVSGVLSFVTGTTGQFGTITVSTGTFTAFLSGATVTGNTGQFTTLTGNGAGFTTLTGTTTSGATANFVSGVYSKGIGIGQTAVSTITGVNSFLDLNGIYVQNVSAVAALNIDCSSGNYYTKTITSNSTFTVSNVPVSGRSYAFTIELTVTSGNVTWFGNVQWPGGTAPTLITGRTHLVSFITDDGGSRWRGSSLTNYTT